MPEAPEKLSGSATAEVTGSRRLRVCELALVVAFGYLLSAIGSVYDWWTGDIPTLERGWLVELEGLVSSVLEISLLAYVLYRQGRNLRSIGLTAKLSDVGWAILVMVFAQMIQLPIAGAIAGLPDPPAPQMPSHPLYLLALVPAVASEELIVRAFLMTEVAALTGSMALAVFASVSFSTLYHLYQGLPAALMHAGTFFVFAAFYASTRRVTPLIVAHSLHNLWVFILQSR